MNKTLAIIVAILLTVFGGWLVLAFVREALRLYDAADANLKLGVITAGGSALAFVINNAVQSSRERRARLFEAKREAYGTFFQSFMSFFHRICTRRNSPRAGDSKSNTRAFY